VSEPTEVLTAFTVIVDLNGIVAISGEVIPTVVPRRPATLDDVEMYSAHLARQAGRAALLSILSPAPEPTAADRVAEALARRSED
jgi:hypothetical protein